MKSHFTFNLLINQPPSHENADNYAWFATAYWFDIHFLDVNHDRKTLLRRDPEHARIAQDGKTKRQVADETGTADAATQSAGLDILDESGDQVNGGLVYDDDAEVQEEPGDIANLPDPINCTPPGDDDGLPSCQYIVQEYAILVSGDSEEPTPVAVVTVATSFTVATSVRYCSSRFKYHSSRQQRLRPHVYDLQRQY
ncbi:MAG: hypothetical protein Q9226_002359 [Calogaya cf. arnoldii]